MHRINRVSSEYLNAFINEKKRKKKLENKQKELIMQKKREFYQSSNGRLVITNANATRLLGIRFNNTNKTNTTK